jgi:two-component system response regulator VicR
MLMSNGRTILVVEDEKNIVDIIAYNLQKEGYNVLEAYNGEEGLAMALENQCDLVLLDVMLPLMDGFDVCRKIREKSNLPIIMLTAREEEVDKVLGLELGADDYITKPFSMRELLARIKANIRRMAADNNTESKAPKDSDSVMVIGDLTIDFERYQVTRKSTVIELTMREYELLKFLAMKPGKVFSREEILKNVWGYEGFYGDLRNVDVMVRRLREKLEEDSMHPKYIHTRRGAGYYFNAGEME